MAVNPIQFLLAANASITDGTKTINITGNVDCSRVYSGTAVFLAGTDNPAEAISGTSPDGSGNSTITLRNNWSQGTVTNQALVAFNTNEGLAEAISNVREIVSNVSAIEDLVSTGLIKRIGDNDYEIVSISAQGESLIGASDASSQRSVLGLGSAATKNVGTTDNDVLSVGAFGIGATSAIAPVIGNFDTVTRGGLYGTVGGEVGTPISSGIISTINIADNSTDRHNQFAIRGDEGDGSVRVFARGGVIGGAHTPWEEMFHTGNSENPLNFGIGGDGATAPNNDANDAIEGGKYRSVTSTANTPESGTATIDVSRSFNVVTQVWSDGNTTYSRRSTDTGATWGTWGLMYDSPTEVRAGDFGVGVYSLQSAELKNVSADALKGGLYTGYEGSNANATTGTNPNPTGGGAYSLINVSGVDNVQGTYKTQLATKYTDASSSGVYMKFRTVAAGAFTPWFDVYNSSNIDFHTFEGNAGDVVAYGVATSATEFRAFFPISSKNRPVSLSQNSTVSIKAVAGGDTGNNTLGAGSLLLGSTKMATVQWSGLTGLTAGDTYRVQLDGSGSSIKFNF